MFGPLDRFPDENWPKSFNGRFQIRVGSGISQYFKGSYDSYLT
jgi:hypothetical protein